MTDTAVAAPHPRFRVQRWTPVSLLFTGGLSGLVVALAFGPVLLGENTQNNLIQLYFLVIMAMMWNALAGYGGLVSVGQQGFIGIGAYAAVFLSVQHGLNPYLSMLLATLIGGAIAIPVAAVVLWLRSGAFAIATWVVAEVFAILVSLDPNPAIGGGTGTSALLPFNLRYTPEQRLHYTYWAALGAVAVLLILLFVLLRSRLGGSLQAIRDDEEAAASVGVRVVVAGAGCAAAGTIILAWQLSVLPLGPNSVFGINWTARMIFMVLVGGLGTFEGPIIGAVVLYLLQTYVSVSGVWYFVMLGGVAIGFALLLPRGIWGTVQERFNVQLLPVGYRLRSGD